nr:MAG TPA: hypothetical protein [Caudoviricetes sp.]
MTIPVNWQCQNAKFCFVSFPLPDYQLLLLATFLTPFCYNIDADCKSPL